jgi:hypothetical protein
MFIFLPIRLTDMLRRLIISHVILIAGFIEFLGFIVPFVDVKKLSSRVRNLFATTRRPLSDVEKKQMVGWLRVFLHGYIHYLPVLKFTSI